MQISHKFTNEPPQGLRASLKRTYANIQQDTIDYSNHPAWPNLLYAVAFLHNVVQERKKFGAIGWNVKYDFNRADLMASYQFMMNHLDDLDPKRGGFYSNYNQPWVYILPRNPYYSHFLHGKSLFFPDPKSRNAPPSPSKLKNSLNRRQLWLGTSCNGKLFKSDD